MAVPLGCPFWHSGFEIFCTRANFTIARAHPIAIGLFNLSPVMVDLKIKGLWAVYDDHIGPMRQSCVDWELEVDRVKEERIG